MEQDWVERLQELAKHLGWLKPMEGDAWIINAMAAICAKANIRSTGDFNRFMESK